MRGGKKNKKKKRRTAGGRKRLSGQELGGWGRKLSGQSAPR